MRYLLLGGAGLALLAAALTWAYIGTEDDSAKRAPIAAAPGRTGPQPPMPPPLAAPGAGVIATPPAATAPAPASPAPAAPVATKQEAAPAAAKPAVPAPKPVEPSFDVVRIKPNGDAVFAGRAAPGAKVSIIDGGRAIGEVEADARGEWVYLPTEALPAGARELGLSARHADGSTTESASVVVLYVPDRTKPDATPAVGSLAATQPTAGPAAGGAVTAAKPAEVAKAPEPAAAPREPAAPAVVAVATPRSGDGPSKILQMPGAKTTASGVTVDVVDYDDKGEMVLTGRAASGSSVTVYLDNRPIGQAKVDQDRQWQLRPAQAVPTGAYQMRADEVSPEGRVTSRVAMPFMRSEAPRQPTAGESRVIVQPGNSLWRIARQHYGAGLRFTVIYSANKDQIQDPDLIYPGQVFDLPSVN